MEGEYAYGRRVRLWETMMNKLNTTQLMHYGGANIIVKVFMLGGFGWVMGFCVAMLMQIVWEYNSRRIWINRRIEYYHNNIPYTRKSVRAEWKRTKCWDSIYDTAAAAIGGLVWLM